MPDGEAKDVLKVMINGESIYDIAMELNYDQGVLRVGYYKSPLDKTINKALYNMIIGISLPIIVILIFTIYLSKIILSPIKKLKQAVERISQGDLDSIIDIISNDEIGELSGQFNKMTADLKIYRRELEKQKDLLSEKVNEKTKELQAIVESVRTDKEKLEKQGVAILNILEDAQGSEEKLKLTNLELERKRFELEELNALSDELIGIMSIDDAISVSIKHLDRVMDYGVISFLIFNPLKNGEIVFKAYLKKPLPESTFDYIKKELLNLLTYYKSPGIDTASKVLKNIKPVIASGKIDNKVKLDKMATFIFPLNFDDKIIGALHVASPKDDFYRKNEERDFFRALVSAFSVALARLQVYSLAQQSKTESLVRSLSDGVIMFDNEKRIILINPEAAKLASPGKEISNLFDLNKVFAGTDFSLLSDEVIHEGRLVRIDELKFKNLIYELFITPVRDYNNQIVGGALILHNITHIKEVDQMKTEFVSIASHQLRTPLTAIKLFTEMLVKEEVGKLNDDQKEYLDNVYQSTERMVKLVNDLLSLSRLESGRLKIEPAQLDLAKLIRELIEEVQPLAGNKKCAISFEAKGADSAEIFIDPDLIRQVFHNLLTNAIRYSKESGGKIEVKLAKDRENYIFSVKDDGIGIAKEDQARIFEKFFRADNAVKTNTDGTGLGLYVCNMIVEALTGKVRFESAPGQGTTFFVELPVKGAVKKEGDKSLSDPIAQVSYS
jgi:signal transduction histidine kinase